MVTAPVPVSAESRIASTPLAAPSQGSPAISFESVYQDLPQLLLDELTAGSQIPASTSCSGAGQSDSTADPTQPSESRTPAKQTGLWAPAQLTAALNVQPAISAKLSLTPQLADPQQSAAALPNSESTLPQQQQSDPTGGSRTQPAIASLVIPQAPAPVSIGAPSSASSLSQTNSDSPSRSDIDINDATHQPATAAPAPSSETAAITAALPRLVPQTSHDISSTPAGAPVAASQFATRQPAQSANLPNAPQTALPEAASNIVQAAIQAQPATTAQTIPTTTPATSENQQTPAKPSRSARGNAVQRNLTQIATQTLANLPGVTVTAPPSDGRVQNLAAHDSDSDESSPRATPQLTPAASSNPGLTAALPTHTDNLAFSLRLATPDSGAKHTRSESQTAPERTHPANESRPARSTEPASQPDDTRATAPDRTPAAELSARAATITWHDSTAGATHTAQASIELSEPLMPVHSNVVAAVHDIPAPEAPRAAASNEILLQLGGKDQPAAIRLSERGGSVNVSVHAADPDLRTTLRSNLNDLTTQLAHQGWKTESVKTGTLLTRAGSTPDAKSDTEQQPGQQNFSNQGGDRQPQRDRRGSGAQWLNEFEEQTSGNSGGRS